MNIFEINNRNFWIAQLGGWAIFALANFLIQWLVGMPMQLVLHNTASASISGLITSTAYREGVRRLRWHSWHLPKLILFIIAATTALSIFWYGITSLIFGLLDGQFALSVNDMIGNLGNGGLLFLIWNLIYFFLHYFARYQSSEIERWRLEAENKAARINLLESQLNPHFVFNTLNNIRALVQEDPQAAREMLMNFSDLFRYTLQHNKRKVVKVEEEIEMAQHYLSLMKIQFEQRLRYSIDLAPEAKEADIPPMMIQLLVENAIKHGISHISEGGEIAIMVKKQKNRLLASVSNTGPWRINDGDMGAGLDNIRNRLQLNYGTKGTLHILKEENRVTVSLQLPDQTPDDESTDHRR